MGLGLNILEFSGGERWTAVGPDPHQKKVTDTLLSEDSRMKTTERAKTMNVYEGIECIRSLGSYSIDSSGEIVTSGEVVKQGSVLEVGGGGMSITGGSITVGRGSVVSSFGSGGTSMNIDGVSIQSNGGKFILRGPPNRILVVNGVQTTFGSVGASGVPSTAQAAPVPKKHKLAAGTRLTQLLVNGHGECVIDGAFLGDNLRINVSGSGDVKLPARTFSTLTATIMGSGDVYGTCDGDRITKTKELLATVTGSGDIRELTVLDSGVVSVTGSGSIVIDAVDPSKISKSSVGSGRVRVRTAAPERSAAAAAAPVQAATAKKRNLDSTDHTKRSRTEE